MHYNLLFNGCSYTWGAELEGINRDYEYQHTNRFSHLVSENTGLTYANISKAGASNERILRTTVKWFEEGNTCDHAIIQWTHRWRVEYFSNFNLLKTSINSNQKPRFFDIIPLIKEIYNSRGNDLTRNFISIQNAANDQNNEDRCMYWMEKLLKDKCSFDYLKMQKESEVVDEYYKISPYHKYRTKFPMTYIIGDILPKNKVIYYCKKIPGYPILNGSHPNESGHRRIADYIINNFQYFKVDAL
tara:strand:- start:772 stop:1503 length:732 start_codon:yes stop_codon:yes gene_type:complete